MTFCTELYSLVEIFLDVMSNGDSVECSEGVLEDKGQKELTERYADVISKWKILSEDDTTPEVTSIIPDYDTVISSAPQSSIKKNLTLRTHIRGFYFTFTTAIPLEVYQVIFRSVLRASKEKWSQQ